MNKIITIYELLGLVKDGKAPKKIKTGNIIYELDNKKTYLIWADEIYHEVNKDYIWLNFKHINSLNDEVEIIEEPQPTKEEIKEYTNNFLEAWTPMQQQFGKLFDELIRIKNDLGLNLEDFTKEEPQEHKIPEKIPEEIIVGKKQPTHRIKKIEKKINEILDYLEEIE